MQIDAEHNALFMLVRSGLWETAVEPPSLPLSDDSWSRIFEIARNQTVSGIAYRGLQYLPDEMLPPMQVMMRWMAEVDRMERTSHAIDTANIQLSQLFQSQGLTPITVKGQGVARLYEHPELRQAGGTGGLRRETPGCRSREIYREICALYAHVRQGSQHQMGWQIVSSGQRGPAARLDGEDRNMTFSEKMRLVCLAIPAGKVLPQLNLSKISRQSIKIRVFEVADNLHFHA